ncbi:MAG: UDP-N-acetylmuramoyl-tripeptide--D-alanyl-D-alanine ligase [Deltaproteobacteria bacterium]
MFYIKDVVAATSGVLGPGVVAKHFAGVSTDTRTLQRGDIFVALKGPRFDGHDFIGRAVEAGARAVVYDGEAKAAPRHRGVAYVRVRDTLAALGDLARFHRRRFGIPVIAVTGSNGKTTTKEMIAHLLAAKYRVLKNEGTQNNLIGVPLTLLKTHSKHDVCVVEMGTNRAGEIGRLADIARPNVGVITNIGPAHLEFLGDLQGVYREKIELIRKLAPPGIALLNRGDMLLGKLARIRTRPVFFYGVNREAEFSASEVTFGAKGITFLYNRAKIFEIRHAALHNVSNALAAVGCAVLLGIDSGTIGTRLAGFDSPDMRLKEIRLEGRTVFDDSYNSNPQSLKQAIDVLCRHEGARRRILVMGDMMELGRQTEEFHAYFGRYVAQSCIDVLVTVGAHTRLTAKSAVQSGMKATAVHSFAACAPAVKFFERFLCEGDVLLVKGSRSMRMEEIVRYLIRTE